MPSHVCHMVHIGVRANHKHMHGAVAPGRAPAQRCRTYNAALSELLHFHDCALPASTAAPTGGRMRSVAAGGDGRSRPLQAALLSLSQLHLEHGYVAAATTALLEAVDVDQGSGDAEALVMCLLQLCVIMRATPPFDHDRGAKSPTAMMQVSPVSSLPSPPVASPAQHRRHKHSRIQRAV